MKLSQVADVAFIAAALVVMALGAERVMTPRVTPSQRPDPLRVKVGQPVEIPGASLKEGRKTLVLVANSQCRYCTASLDFYRRLADLQERRSRGVRFIAIGSETGESLAQYFSGANVALDQVIVMKAADTPSMSTPTLFLVDGTGKVASIWVGQQSPQNEVAIIKALS